MDPLLNYAGRSFIGRRKNNEDSMFPDENPSKSNITFFAVADGMGGANAGEVASSLAIRTISSFLNEQLSPHITVTNEEIIEILKDGFRKIQINIADAIKANPAYSGMGTTMVLILQVKGKWFVANIGDSRLYYINGDKAIQLTRDHTLLQEYIESHNNAPDEEWLNKYSSYIVKALDGTECLPDVFPIDEEFKDGDDSCFLLSSDGLLPGKGNNGELPYASIIHNSKDVHEAAEQLICQAFQKGSADNITVVIIETQGFKHNTSASNILSYPPVLHTQQSKQIPAKRKSILPVFLLMSGLILCLLGILYLFLPDKSMSHDVGSNNVRISSSMTIKSTQPVSVKNPGNNSSWDPFKEEWYEMGPLDIKSYLTWNTYSGKNDVSTYKILIYDNKSLIDSAIVDKRTSSYPLNKFEHLKPNLNKRYLFTLKAMLSDGSSPAKSIEFNYK